MFLRQSTASQEILLGPFVDSTDGVTPETGLTIANTDIKLWKGGTTAEIDKNSGGATHIASGRYSAVLDATDTNTVGMLEVNVAVSGALPVRRQFYVLEEVVFDRLMAADATGYQVPIWSNSSVAVAAIVDGMWDEILGDHVIPGSAAVVLGDGAADAGEANANAQAVRDDWVNGGRLDLLLDLAVSNSLLARQILGNKHTVVESPPGTFTISVRNDADDATVRTIVYTPATGARTVS